VQKYPAITFRSRKVQNRAKDKYSVLGDLTIHGVTLPVELDAQYLGSSRDPWGNERIGFSAKAAINRRDFGLNWNQVLEGGGFLVGEQVEITLDVEALKAQAAEQAA
jgi:polyisoprenoid-binding protein YceI